MKFINLWAIVIALVFGGNSFAVEAKSKELWENGKKTITDLSLGSYYHDEDNPNAEEAQKLSIEWIIEFQIITDEEKLKRINMANFGKLIGKAHPQAPPEKLLPIVLFATWLFLYDDDQMENASDENFIDASTTRTLEILAGNLINENDMPLNKGLHDIILRINKLNASAEWKSRLANDVKDYCRAMLWEFKNRRPEKKIPSLESYKEHRPNTGATKPMFDFIEFLDDRIVIPAKIFDSAYFAEMRLLAANLIDWENDIGSAWKELDEGIHNLIFVHNAETGQGYQKAFSYASQELSSDLNKFIRLAKAIPEEMEPHKEAIALYIDGLWQWAVANHFWASGSSRYNPPKWANSQKNSSNDGQNF